MGLGEFFESLNFEPLVGLSKRGTNFDPLFSISTSTLTHDCARTDANHRNIPAVPKKDGTWFCPDCGNKNIAYSMFCSECGRDV